jgi:hypothetical protein
MGVQHVAAFFVYCTHHDSILKTTQNRNKSMKRFLFAFHVVIVEYSVIKLIKSAENSPIS